jgi:16S rRNA (cytosine967-C5)-methyltransferase
MARVQTTAAKALARLLRHDGSLASVLPEYSRELQGKDAAQLHEICYGVMRWYFQLQAILEILVNKPLRKKDFDVYALLLIGCYQITYMRTPSYAAVAETVEAANDLKKSWAKGLLNAVLRNYSRNEQALHDSLGVIERNAFPHWLARKLQKSWPQEYEQILKASNVKAPLTLRINPQRVTREVYLQQLSVKGLRGRKGSLCDTAIILDDAVDVHELPGFDEGNVSVQDEGAQLAAVLLDARQGHRVLDACAAPGGKTAHILERTASLDLTALDISEKRVERIHDNLKRLDLQARVVCGDAANPDAWHEGQLYDRILLDVPCSATGVIRRNPDIKFLRRESDIEELFDTQIGILRQAWAVLRPGGTLLYATCSILPDENEWLLAEFLASQNDAEHEDIVADWGVEKTLGRQLLPLESQHDGFYYARLTKA